uniref:Putative secreted protein n=1 Tax=Ixodes ricinus TaxID=34613 RepID=A0A131Y637_IXORI
MKAALGVAILLACALQWPRGISAAEECELRGAAKCLKNLSDVLNGNMPHLAQEEGSALDGQVDILIGDAVEATRTCLVPQGSCPESAEPGKEVAEKLLAAFQDALGVAALVLLVPLVAQRLVAE